MEFKGKELKSFKEFQIDKDITIGVIQGERGVNPDLDIRVVYIDKNTKSKKVPRTLQHIHWAIDLLVKKEYDKELTKKYI
ncbi:hypothetical protein J4429_04155 [Candidatus Pacearchaeota archaeon]|nr:hypothetical protein [Candidatus Pacearchaeota archaeon]